MDARYQAPTLSRFLSEDPALITPSSGQALADLLQDPQKLNFYSYVENNPLKNVDPNGRQVAQAALLGVGAIAITTGFLLYPSQTQQLLQQLDPGTFRTGTLAEPGRGFGFMLPSPQDPGDPNSNGPRWKGLVQAGLLALGAAEEIHAEYGKFKDFGESLMRKLKGQFNSGVDNKGSVTIRAGSPSGSYINSGSSYLPNLQYYISNNVYSSSLQARSQAVQSFNSTSGASSPQAQLFITPNGAVVNWNGGVISAAPSSK
jgi:RHS repeat-associated protein